MIEPVPEWPRQKGIGITSHGVKQGSGYRQKVVNVAAATKLMTNYLSKLRPCTCEKGAP
jgi:hypothetical protein